MWTTHPSYKKLIKTWWNGCDARGKNGFGFMKKLQHVKKGKVERLE